MSGSGIRCGMVWVGIIVFCGVCRLAAAGTVFEFEQSSYTVPVGDTVTVRVVSAWAEDLGSAGFRVRGIDSNYFDLLSVTESTEFDSFGTTIDATNDATSPGVDGPAALFPTAEVFSTGEQLLDLELEANAMGDMFLDIIDWDTRADNTVEAVSGDVVDDQFESADYYERIGVSVTPEPSGAALLLIALSGFLVVRRRKEGDGIGRR